MNQVILIGRITKDLTLQYTANQKPYLNFTVACDRKFKDQNGQRQADFISCKAFNNNAEFIAKYFAKGRKIAITGNIQTGKYEKNGQTIYTTDVMVDSAEFVESLNAQAPQEQAQEQIAPDFPKEDTQKIMQRIQNDKQREQEKEELDFGDLPFEF